MATTFATGMGPVLVAITLATLLVHAGSVLIGSLFALALPTSLIPGVNRPAVPPSSCSRPGRSAADELSKDDEARAAQRTLGDPATIGTAFFLAELGDNRHDHPRHHGGGRIRVSLWRERA